MWGVCGGGGVLTCVCVCVCQCVVCVCVCVCVVTQTRINRTHKRERARTQPRMHLHTHTYTHTHTPPTHAPTSHTYVRHVHATVINVGPLIFSLISRSLRLDQLTLPYPHPSGLIPGKPPPPEKDQHCMETRKTCVRVFIIFISDGSRRATECKQLRAAAGCTMS